MRNTQLLTALFALCAICSTAAAAPSADDPVPIDPRATQAATQTAPESLPSAETPPPLTDEVPRLELPKVEPPGPPPVFVHPEKDADASAAAASAKKTQN